MEYKQMTQSDTIVAVSTAPGVGGIAVIRLSGKNAFEIADNCWTGKKLSTLPSHTAHLGTINNNDGNIIDQVVATVFKSPKSFTGEDTVEISCHGSLFIQQEIVNQLIRSGARAAGPGEFTQRAFLNGKMDLAQAEGIADLIASTSKAAHAMAMSQTRGQFSAALKSLRDEMLDLTVLLELELDFSEEDVEFADRTRLVELTTQLKKKVDTLASSFASGNAFKTGIPVAIAGAPNAGKSSLLNAILQDDKAIVSPIPGTTRDTVEDTISIDGIQFRFIDTAGIRDTSDKIEQLGIERSHDSISKAKIVLWLIDSTTPLQTQIDTLNNSINESSEYGIKQHLSILISKSDLLTKEHRTEINNSLSKIKIEHTTTEISTVTENGLDTLRATLTKHATSEYNPESDIIVTNARHYQSLILASESLQRILDGITQQLPTDLLAADLKEATGHLGAITGEITSSDVLQTVFSRFCIGK
jgi:tRNA modification GTPase